MVMWSLAAELLGLIIHIILILYYHERRLVSNSRRKIYQVCLWISVLTILLNIVCVHMVTKPAVVSHGVNMLLNSLYFILCVLTCSVMAVYMFALTLEHVYDKRCLRITGRIVLILNIIFWGIVIWNLRSGVLFYFDENQIYIRGPACPLNRIGYLVMAIEMLMLVLCYMRNRRSVSRPVVRLIRTMPVIAAICIVFQHIYKDLQLNGMFMAIVNMVIFISFQTRRSEVDSLTFIGNRNSFFEELSLRIASRQYFQVVLVCLKQFSLVNEKFSYKKGDEFLYNIARELDHILPGAKAFRFGNVEFAVLLPYATEEESTGSLKRIQERFEERWELGAVGSYIQAYFTDVMYRGQEWNATQIIEYLESGIHYAKKEPGGLRRFDIKLLEQLNRRKRILDIMETSIRQRRFKVWYQPVFNLKTNRFSSAEALLRLRDYDGEPVSPSEFIPLAEETGLIDDLSWIVLEEVCTLLGQMRDKIDSISINLSMQQFEDRSLCARIHECLNRCGLNPDQLKIEVTERVLLQDMDYMKRMMEEMTGEGFGFYLDDFGTGYSNISCALSLPFEYIKLDRSLLVRLPGDSKVQVFVRSMVETFHAMGQKIVAEGVEEEEQIELLRQFGVDCVQGYYYGKPMPEDEFRAAVAKGWEEQRR